MDLHGTGRTRSAGDMTRLLDTRRRIETPEGVHLEMSAAGPIARGWAWAIDQIGRGIIYTGAAIPAVFMGELGMGLMLVFMFLTEWFYPVVFEVWMRGATPGKAAMGLRVVHADGSPVSWTSSILRNLLRVADFLPFAFLAGLVAMLTNSDFRRIGDLVAGTVVVYAEPPLKVPRPAAARPIPPPIALDVAEQRAIIDYSERASSWTDDRAEELAAVLVPVVGGSPRDAVHRLHGVARWLLGERA